MSIVHNPADNHQQFQQLEDIDSHVFGATGDAHQYQDYSSRVPMYSVEESLKDGEQAH
jgi:hypothetical protein